MRLQTFTISEEVLSLLEFAVGFEIKDNKDMDYALELLCNSVMPKKPKSTIAERESLMQMLKTMFE